ncbi:hypothetical protein [Saccharothrix luteola]|uniref:hypothetical protein n=1 Tax=Saccharothrix luteola TaxID=2893018 RepID=UPI001E4AF1DD|nr:hypothetical protein [Saccharothrix luteola]MCC8250148.1 hypothetical protein [Saccharothrix luteola]
MALVLSGAGMAAGYLAGAVGSAGVAAAAVLRDAVLLFVSLFAPRRPATSPPPSAYPT